MAFSDYAFKFVPLLVLAVSLYIVFREKCHIFDSAVYLHLGTKSPYRNVANLNTDSLNFSGCTEEKIWMVIRHGTRTPKTKLIREMKQKLNYFSSLIINNINSGEGELCSDVKTNFQNWELNLNDANSQLLTHEGEDEMLMLSERMKMRFPNVLSNSYSNDTYKFRYTATQRASESSRYFTIGLFGRQVSQHVWYPEALAKDPILRFYKLCDKWMRTINKNPATFEEQTEFSKSDEMSNVLERISKRLGFKSPLEIEDGFLMYQMCCYETAWSSSKVSPWCSIFTKDEAEVFEYYDDLKYYWRDGYGFKLNHEQACPAFNDMLKLFLSDSSKPKGVFYFTHSGTLLKMLSFLGLYKDSEILRSENYKSNLDRLWKVSQIDAFGTNLAFILYKCSDGIDKVLIYHQERPVRIPGCPNDSDLCPLSTIMSIFKNSISDCDFNKICSINNL